MLSVLLDSTASGTGANYIGVIISFVLIMVVFYIFSLKPQKDEQKRKDIMRNEMAVGDTVLTSSGFYGTLIDIDEDTVIVEFGNNKNCRIPMQRACISAVEKPEDSVSTTSDDK